MGFLFGGKKLGEVRLKGEYEKYKEKSNKSNIMTVSYENWLKKRKKPSEPAGSMKVGLQWAAYRKRMSVTPDLLDQMMSREQWEASRKKKK